MFEVLVLELIIELVLALDMTPKPDPLLRRWETPWMFEVLEDDVREVGKRVAHVFGNTVVAGSLLSKVGLDRKLKLPIGARRDLHWCRA